MYKTIYQTIYMLKGKVMTCLLAAAGLLAEGTAEGQNLNNPNKMGPLGTQVNVLSGNLYLNRNDLFIPGRGFNINAAFSYNSFLYDRDWGYGKGWSFSLDIRWLHDTADGKIIAWGDGREDNYRAIASGGYQTPKGFFSTLMQYSAGKFALRELNGTRYLFEDSTHKRITRVENPNGNFLQFNYTNGRLLNVQNESGQSVSFTYHASGKLATIVDALTAPVRTYRYSYDVTGNMIEVTDPLNGKLKYSYLVNGPMKTLTDKNNNTVNIIYFPDLSTRELIGCNKRVSFSYDTTSRTTITTDHLDNGNQVTKYTYQKVDNFSWITSLSGNCCGYNQRFEYNELGNLVKLTNANGSVYTFTYDNFGNRLSTTDPLGNQMRFTYTTDFHKVKTFTDGRGKVYTLNYDNKGNPVQMIQPGGLVTTMAYNAQGDMTTFTDPNGNVHTLTYDAFGYPAQFNRPLGNTVSYAYDARGNVVSFTDAKGALYKGEYDALNRLVKITDAANQNVFLTYDAEDNLVLFKNRKGQQMTYAWDASNRVVMQTNAKGAKTFYSYDGMNNLLSTTDALGNTTRYAYDNLNRMVSMTDALGHQNRYAYDGNGNQISIITADGAIINNTFDKLDRLVKSADQNGAFFTREYDAMGNLVRNTGPSGDVLNFGYDDLDRLVKVTDALGKTVQATYDNNGNLLTVTNRNGKVARYTYNALNRRTHYEGFDGGSMAATYDANGNLLTLKDQNNNTTVYQYDILNRRTRTTFPDGRYKQLTLDALGNPLVVRQPSGLEIGFTYDSLNRVVQRTLPGNQLFIYTYDALNRLLTATNTTGTVQFSYDAIGRKTAETVSGKTVRYQYNVPAREIGIVYPDSTLVTKKHTTRGLLSSLLHNDSLVADFSYSPANRLEKTAFGNGVVSARQYDFANRLSSLQTANGSLQQGSFTYNDVGHKTSLKRSNGFAGTETFQYDDNHRLTAFTREATAGLTGTQQQYQYDAADNRITKTVDGSTTNYTVNALNQVTGSTGATNAQFLYDDNGNMVFDGTFHKVYDAEGRLLKDSASPATQVVYAYDALGRRVQKTANGRRISYVYAGLSQVQQVDAASDTVVNNTVFANYMKPVMMTRGNARFFFHQDDMNSVEALTNRNGALVERYYYDPYGKQTTFDSTGAIRAASVAGNRFGYTGHEHDAETGTIRFPYRQYSPELGRFYQRDLLGYAPSMNMYNYVNNNPANYVDLLGLEPVTSSQGMDQQITDMSSGAQGAVSMTEDYLHGQISNTEKAIQQTEAFIAQQRQWLKDASKHSKNRINKILKMIEGQKKYLKDLKKMLENNKNSTKLKVLGKLGPALTALDLWWKVEIYRNYKAKCPGSDEDMLQQSIMVKDIATSSTGFNPATWVIHLGDFGTEKIFGTSATTKTVELTFWANEWYNDNATFNTPFGDINLNPFGPLNWIGTEMGNLSVASLPGQYEGNPTYDVNPFNY